MVEADLHLDRGSIHSDYHFRICGEAERTASKGIGTVFRSSCDVGWDFVAASSVDDAPTIFRATGSAWAEDLNIRRHGSTLAMERWFQRRRVEELHPMGRR